MFLKAPRPFLLKLMHDEVYNISWIDWVAMGNPGGTRKVLAKYGYPFPAREQLAEAARMMVSEVGAEAVEDLLDVHPDKEMIIERQKVIQKALRMPKVVTNKNYRTARAGVSFSGSDSETSQVSLNSILDEIRNLNPLKNQQLINAILIAGVGYLIFKSLSTK